MEQCPRRLRGECALSKQACGLITHHLFYPRRQYEEAGPIPASFRELSFNKVQMCKSQEIDLHKALPEGPPMPTMEFMTYLVELARLRQELVP